MNSINEKYTTDKILIFDIDDTIAITAAKIIVTNSKTGETFELTPEEFNHYEKHKNHIVNFEQFKSLEIMKAGKLIDKYFNILKTNYKKGIAIGIITNPPLRTSSQVPSGNLFAAVSAAATDEVSAVTCNRIDRNIIYLYIF
jgi:hypothetical protein